LHVDRYDTRETFLSAEVSFTKSKMADGRHIGKIRML